MPINETLFGAVVVEPVGQIPRAYVIRTAQSQISILDTKTECEAFCEYFCHTFTGEDQHRDMLKKILRVKVYGQGAISSVARSGIMTVTAGDNREDIYIYSALAANPAERILWEQGCLGLRGRAFDLKVQLHGTGLRIREVSLEYTILS